MTELLQGLPIGQVGAGALLLVSCWWVTRLVLTGRLVPRQQLLDVQADRDKWRESAETWQQSALKLGMAVEKVVTVTEATNHAMTALQQLALRGEPPT